MSTNNLCFWADIRKLVYTPVNTSFTVRIKMGLKGSKLYRHIFVMNQTGPLWRYQHFHLWTKLSRSLHSAFWSVRIWCWMPSSDSCFGSERLLVYEYMKVNVLDHLAKYAHFLIRANHCTFSFTEVIRGLSFFFFFYFAYRKMLAFLLWKSCTLIWATIWKYIS